MHNEGGPETSPAFSLSMKVQIGIGISIALTLLLLAGATEAQNKPPRERPTKTPDPLATPTVDRLAPPPTVPSPTQADDGAYHYWVWCQPCHGDVGQGLTDEWRAEYPEDHQNCWNSGCHGINPYTDGFILPQNVPAVIGQGTLLRFQTMGELYEYVRYEMPYEYPGALDEEKALAVTAFLAREHGKWDGKPLTVENIDQIHLIPTPEPTVVPQAKQVLQSATSILRDSALPVTAGILILLLLGGTWLWRRKV
jgi:hypothetical protein